MPPSTSARSKPIAFSPHAIVLAGGTGRRLGGASKADLDLGGMRLLDRVLAGLAEVAGGLRVVVAPESVEVGEGVVRTLEEPPGGGPLAGIGAGLDAIGAADGWVVVCAVDTPGIGALSRLLVEALADGGFAGDGAVIVGGRPRAYRQYLQAIYGIAALRAALAEAGPLRGRGVTRALHRLSLLEVRVEGDLCRDVDTLDDLEFWRRRAAT